MSRPSGGGGGGGGGGGSGSYSYGGGGSGGGYSGGSGGGSGGGADYGSFMQQGFAQAMGMAAAQAAWERQKLVAERQARIMRTIKTAAKRLEAADQARKDGDIRLAVRTYTTVAATRPPNQSSLAAQVRLTELADEVLRQLERIESSLEGTSLADSPNSSNSPNSSANRLSDEAIRTAFEQYGELLFQYGEVPEVKQQLISHVARQRAKPAFAEVLNEPMAKQLLEVAETHMKQNDRCCAYWSYQDAARLDPAPSALEAAKKFEALREDAQVIADAQTCRELRWCHSAYSRAITLAKTNQGGRAREIFGEILKRAPEDTVVYREALAQYKTLRHVD